MSIRSSAIGLATVVVLMGAGAAQSLSGSNTVFSDDIAPGEVNFSDIHENAVTSSRIAPGAVFGSDIASNAVTGAKVAQDSITGADINEALIPGFKQVLTARVNTVGTLLAGEATTAGRADVANGKYKVTFARSVVGCFAVASPGDHSDNSGHIFQNQALATQFVPGSLPNGDNNAIFVISKIDNDADNFGVFTDSAFTLVVVCP